MPLPPLPANAEVEYTTKKIHLGPNSQYDDNQADVHIKTGENGEYDGKVTDVDIKIKALGSAAVNRVLRTAAAGKSASPTIEVAMEVPSHLVTDRPTRITLVVADRSGHHLPVIAYGPRRHSSTSAARRASPTRSLDRGAAWCGSAFGFAGLTTADSSSTSTTPACRSQSRSSSSRSGTTSTGPSSAAGLRCSTVGTRSHCSRSPRNCSGSPRGAGCSTGTCALRA